MNILYQKQSFLRKGHLISPCLKAGVLRCILISSINKPHKTTRAKITFQHRLSLHLAPVQSLARLLAFEWFRHNIQRRDLDHVCLVDSTVLAVHTKPMLATEPTGILEAPLGLLVVHGVLLKFCADLFKLCHRETLLSMKTKTL